MNLERIESLIYLPNKDIGNNYENNLDYGVLDYLFMKRGQIIIINFLKY